MANKKRRTKKCQYPDCPSEFLTNTKLEIHQSRHDTTNEHLNMLYTLDKEAKIDRGKMIYQDTGEHMTIKPQLQIKFNKTEKKWECMVCNKQENEQDRKNMIQHARGHRRNKITRRGNRRAKDTKGRHHIYTTRMQTLLVQVPDNNLLVHNRMAHRNMPNGRRKQERI